MQKIKKTFGFVALAALMMITGIILFDRLVPPYGERLVFSKDDTNICVVNATGWHRRCLVKGRNPAWSPDGKRITFYLHSQPAKDMILMQSLLRTSMGLI